MTKKKQICEALVAEFKWGFWLLRAPLSSLHFQLKKWESDISQLYPVTLDGGNSNAAFTKKILILSHLFPHPSQPGLGNFILTQVKALRAEGIDARVISGRPLWVVNRRSNPVFWPIQAMINFFVFLRIIFQSKVSWGFYEGVPVIYFPYPIFWKFWTHGWLYQKCLTFFEKKVNGFNPDIIHAHTSYLDGSAGTALKKKWACPLIITEHTGPFSSLTEPRLVKRRTRKNLESSDLLICVSNKLKHDILSTFPNLEVPSEVIPNIIDTDLFTLSDRYRFNRTSPRIFFVGYLVPIKNPPLLLKAFSLFTQVIPGATLHIVGNAVDPAYGQHLKKITEELGISESIKWYGYRSQEDVADLIKTQCDVLLLTSKEETFGCVVAEALACGKPVVTTPCGGPQDLIVKSELGIVCADSEANSICKALELMVGNLDHLDSRKIHEFVKERVSSPVVSQKIINCYKKIL